MPTPVTPSPKFHAYVMLVPLADAVNDVVLPKRVGPLFVAMRFVMDVSVMVTIVVATTVLRLFVAVTCAV